MQIYIIIFLWLISFCALAFAAIHRKVLMTLPSLICAFGVTIWYIIYALEQLGLR